MKRYVFDSSALISYFDGEHNAEKVADLLEEINEKGLDAFLCVINLGEIYYHFLRTGGNHISDEIFKLTKTLPIKIIEANVELTLSAGRIKAFNKMSYADCFAAALAESKRAFLVSSDREFKQIENKVKLYWI
ncbi:MAG: hypothetical protein HGGPFJEG_01967 [Ignavibacteria bacterium]|nr:hypothetical protein [Ignavibacteria bacterium]